MFYLITVDTEHAAENANYRAKPKPKRGKKWTSPHLGCAGMCGQFAKEWFLRQVSTTQRMKLFKITFFKMDPEESVFQNTVSGTAIRY